MIELNDKISRALISTNLVRRYEELSGRFSSERTPSDECLVYVEKDEVGSYFENSIWNV